MNKNKTATEMIFQKLGNIQWDGNDAYEIITKHGVKLVLSPNGTLYDELPAKVIIDEICVRPRSRRQGHATKAMKALCRLADKYQFDLLGGPIGFDSPWRDKYVSWVLSFGFEPDPSDHLQTHDPNTFYVRRPPRPSVKT